jgi:hypothetical protein
MSVRNALLAVCVPHQTERFFIVSLTCAGGSPAEMNHLYLAGAVILSRRHGF